MSALPMKVDMPADELDVRLVPVTDIGVRVKPPARLAMSARTLSGSFCTFSRRESIVLPQNSDRKNIGPSFPTGRTSPATHNAQHRSSR